MVWSLSQGRDCRRQRNNEQLKKREMNVAVKKTSVMFSARKKKPPTVADRWRRVLNKTVAVWGFCYAKPTQKHFPTRRRIWLWQKVGRQLLQNVFFFIYLFFLQPSRCYGDQLTDAEEGILWMTIEVGEVRPSRCLVIWDRQWQLVWLRAILNW